MNSNWKGHRPLHHGRPSKKAAHHIRPCCRRRACEPPCCGRPAGYGTPAKPANLASGSPRFVLPFPRPVVAAKESKNAQRPAEFPSGYQDVAVGSSNLSIGTLGTARLAAKRLAGKL